MWGFRPGLWRNTEKAYIVNADGSERPAAIWLRAYVNGTYIPTTSVSITTSTGASTISTDKATLQMEATVLPGDATITAVTWTVDDEDLATINKNGLLSALKDGVVTVTGEASDGTGASDEMEITISNQVIDDVELTGSKKENIELYPNPALDGAFTIGGIEEITGIRVLDIMGKQVKDFNILNQSSINIRMDVVPGVYIIQLSNDQKVVTKKLIIK